MTSGYVELHAKSFYSFGLGASHVHELLAQAKEYGYSCPGPDRHQPLRGAGVRKARQQPGRPAHHWRRADPDRRLPPHPAGQDAGRATPT